MDPTTGTFLSVDPVVAQYDDPQALNAYAYARNNPVSYIDPTGRSPIDLPPWEEIIVYAEPGLALDVWSANLITSTLPTVGDLIGASFIAGPGHVVYAWNAGTGGGGSTGQGTSPGTSPPKPSQEDHDNEALRRAGENAWRPGEPDVEKGGWGYEMEDGSVGSTEPVSGPPCRGQSECSVDLRPALRRVPENATIKWDWHHHGESGTGFSTDDLININNTRNAFPDYIGGYLLTGTGDLYFYRAGSNPNPAAFPSSTSLRHVGNVRQ